MVVVFDLTNRESFKHVENWIAEVHSIVGTDVKIMVLGNKCDLHASRDITSAEIEVSGALIPLRDSKQRLAS